MKDMLERHAERLAPEERLAIWAHVTGPAVAPRRAPLRWAVPALACAVVTVAVFALVSPRRIPAPHTIPAPVPGPVASEVPAPPNPETRSGASAAGKPAQARAHAAIARAPLEPATAVPSTAPTPTAELGTIAGRITDAQGRPAAFVNVIVLGTRQGTMTDENGGYRIPSVRAESLQVKVMAIGYEPVLASLRVPGGEVATLDVRLGDSKLLSTVQEVQVRSEREIQTRSSGTRRSIAAEELRSIPVDNLQQATRGKSGVVSEGGTLHFRGGRGGEVKFQFDGITSAPPAVSAPPAPPVVPITGGTTLPNDEPYDAMFFRHYGVNPFVAADEDPLSTFAVDVDAASYTVTRRYLGLSQLPPADAVRVEEFVNFFPQGYPRFEREDFRILVDGAPSAFGPGYQLLRVGIKGREVPTARRKPARLTFVVDVSGSMGREDRLGLVKQALRLLVDQLRSDDRVGLVVYGSQGRVLLEPVAVGPGSDGRARLLAAIEQLRIDGSTNAEEGLRLGYEMARRGYAAGALNRIVLCSDGVANVGRTGPASILAQVRSDADRGITLTTVGFGMGNYNDVLMEQLADKGDGNHYYVDDLDEAHRVFVENLTGTLQVIAKDAKVQVEFDSTRVLRYRLIGFENRDVADRDFRNDRVDAGEIGAGHEVTALYEVKLAPGVTSGTLATVRFRWARPEHEGAGAPQVREIEQRFDAAALERRFDSAAPRFRLAAAAAEFAEILRGSYWARESPLSAVLAVARAAADDLRDERADELVQLVGRAAALKDVSPVGGARR